MASIPSTQERQATARSLTVTRSLLIVDPDPDTCALYTVGLGMSGWEALGVADGREALARAIASRPTAVVTETRVPWLDGFELCRLLRRDVATQQTPIVVVTGDADPEDVDRAKQAGADAVLIKPCLPGDLLSAIEAAIVRRAQWIDAYESDSAPRTYGQSKSRRYQRGATTAPPLRPPPLVCPTCSGLLVYHISHVGGVNATLREQWDEYTCSSGCGRFQYRHRTRKVRVLPC